MRRRPVIERLLPKIRLEDRGFLSPCWIFHGSRLPRGYGQIGRGGRERPIYTHQVTYEHFRGVIREGLEIDHLCRVPECCNPYHLEAVPHLENVRRGRSSEVARARHAARKHCKHGHEYTPENTYFYANDKGYRCRGCRTCRPNPVIDNA